MDGKQQLRCQCIDVRCPLAGLCRGVIAVPGRKRDVVGVFVQPCDQSFCRLCVHLRFVDDSLRTGICTAVSGIHRHPVGRIPDHRTERIAFRGLPDPDGEGFLPEP